jgi:hypothetical protein
VTESCNPGPRIGRGAHFNLMSMGQPASDSLGSRQVARRLAGTPAGGPPSNSFTVAFIGMRARLESKIDSQRHR